MAAFGGWNRGRMWRVTVIDTTDAERTEASEKIVGRIAIGDGMRRACHDGSSRRD